MNMIDIPINNPNITDLHMYSDNLVLSGPAAVSREENKDLLPSWLSSSGGKKSGYFSLAGSVSASKA